MTSCKDNNEILQFLQTRIIWDSQSRGGSYDRSSEHPACMKRGELYFSSKLPIFLKHESRAEIICCLGRGQD